MKRKQRQLRSLESLLEFLNGNGIMLAYVLPLLAITLAVSFIARDRAADKRRLP